MIIKINKPLISVIIPTYNSEKFIKRTIDSVINQSGLHELFEIEIIICDDKSTDKTLDICREYPVTIFENYKNQGGPNYGRNLGIINAKGDLIAFLDHDDEWLPFKLKEQINEINKGYEFVYSFYIKKLA